MILILCDIISHIILYLLYSPARPPALIKTISVGRCFQSKNEWKVPGKYLKHKTHPIGILPHIKWLKKPQSPWNRNLGRPTKRANLLAYFRASYLFKVIKLVKNTVKNRKKKQNKKVSRRKSRFHGVFEAS